MVAAGERVVNAVAVEASVTREQQAAVGTAFVRHGGEILLVRRDVAGPPSDRWDGVTRSVDADHRRDAAAACRTALRTLVGIEQPTLVREGERVAGDGGTVVYPFLFDVQSRALTPDESIQEIDWIAPPEMRQRATVPGLWRAYQQVAPTVETVVGDTEHGSAWLSMRALEVLRDRAAVADDWARVADVARELRAGHSDMAALANRLNRTMARAIDDADPEVGGRSPTAIVAAAQETLSAAARADDRAADRAAGLVEGATVATISRSGTVLDALLDADADVIVGESRPAGEGTAVATELTAAGKAVTVTTDAALTWVISGETTRPAPDLVLVGADAVLPDGSVVNKVGTRALGLAASRAGIPLYVVAASDKVAIDERRPTAQSDPAPLGVDPGVETWVPTFDCTPADCIEGIVTEDGLVDPTDVAAIADRHRRHASWDAALD